MQFTSKVPTICQWLKCKNISNNLSSPYCSWLMAPMLWNVDFYIMLKNNFSKKKYFGTCYINKFVDFLNASYKEQQKKKILVSKKNFDRKKNH